MLAVATLVPLGSAVVVWMEIQKSIARFRRDKMHSAEWRTSTRKEVDRLEQLLGDPSTLDEVMRKAGVSNCSRRKMISLRPEFAWMVNKCNGIHYLTVPDADSLCC